MRTTTSKFSSVFLPLCCILALCVFTSTANAQNCLAQLPAVCQAAPYNRVCDIEVTTCAFSFFVAQNLA